MNYSNMKVKELLVIAKSLKVVGRYEMNKAQLISTIEEAKQVVEVQHEEDCSVVNTMWKHELLNPFEGQPVEVDEVQEPVKPGKELLITVITNDGRVLTGSRWIEFEEDLGLTGNAIWKFYKNKGSKKAVELISSITKEKI